MRKAIRFSLIILTKVQYQQPSEFFESIHAQRFPARQHPDGKWWSFRSYRFIQADGLMGLDRVDHAFLSRHGCFLLPSRPALDGFMKEYFLHVHPMLPVIDESGFWGMYSGLGEEPSSSLMSLFTFQAMLAASSTVSLVCQLIPLVQCHIREDHL